MEIALIIFSGLFIFLQYLIGYTFTLRPLKIYIRNENPKSFRNVFLIWFVIWMIFLIIFSCEKLFW